MSLKKMGNKFLRYLLYILYISCIVIVSEVALRAFFPLCENRTSQVQQNINGLKKTIAYERNILENLRSASIRNTTQSKNVRTMRIVCLGASATHQSTQEIKDMWSAILERKLNDHFSDRGLKIEVVAVGSGGWFVWDGYRFLSNMPDNFSPDIVITLFGVNDLCWKGGKYYRYEGAGKRLRAISRTLSYKRGFIIKHIYNSQLYKHIAVIGKIIKYFPESISMRLEWHSKNLPQLRKQYMELPHKEEINRNPDPIIEFKDGIEEIIHYLKAKDIECVVMGQPVLWKNHSPLDEKKSLWFYVTTSTGKVRMGEAWLEKEIERYNHTQKYLADENDCLYIPLDELIPKRLAYFFDDCHFTDEGSHKVGLTVYSAICPIVENVIRKRTL